MISIYKITDKDGKVYVGSTKKNLATRLSGHKSDNKRRPIYFDFDFESCKIELIENCDDSSRYDRENFWIRSLNSINKSRAGRGPIGMKNSQKEIDRKSEHMKRLHSERKDVIERARKNSLTPEKQKLRSIKSHALRKAKMPFWSAIEKKTKKSFGPFQGYVEACSLLGLHESTIIRGLLHGRKNRRFEFIISEGVK